MAAQASTRASSPEGESDVYRREPFRTTPGAFSQSDIVSSSLPHMPKDNRLKGDGSNYLVWRNLLNLYLQSAGYEPQRTITGSLTREDYRVGAYVLTCCSATVQSKHLIGKQSPLEMLNTLDKMFKPQERKRGYLAWLRLSKLQWGDNQSTTEFISVFRKAKKEAVEVNIGLSGDLLAYLLLERARPKYPIWADIQVSQWTDTNPLSVDTLCRALLALPHEPEMSIGLGALTQNGQQRQKGSEKKCSHCNKNGHLEPKCWTKYPAKAPKGREVPQIAQSFGSASEVGRADRSRRSVGWKVVFASHL
jgi:hypothetical protein